MTELGSGDYVYQELAAWPKLPEGWTFREVADVAVDSQDRVYVYNRSEHPVIVFNRDGSFLGSWGEGLFARPHGLTLGRLLPADEAPAQSFADIWNGPTMQHLRRQIRANQNPDFCRACYPGWPGRSHAA